MIYVLLGILIIGGWFITHFFRRKFKLLNILKNNVEDLNFLYFLLKNNLYEKFISNLNKEKNIKHIYIWCKHTKNTYYISEAFNWNETNEGYDFWYKNNLLWVTRFKNLNVTLADLELLMKYNLI